MATIGCMEKTFLTQDASQTQKLGALLARELWGGEVICMTGELGAGKTTFTQGLLKGLGVKGPYTSPTFVIMKQYHITHDIKYGTKGKKMPVNVYHLDAYRVGVNDVLQLGWEEIVADKNNVVIIEWAERLEKIIPADSLWIEFFWTGENGRKIVFKSRCQKPKIKSNPKSK